MTHQLARPARRPPLRPRTTCPTACSPPTTRTCAGSASASATRSWTPAPAAEHAGMESGDVCWTRRASTPSSRAARTPGPRPARWLVEVLSDHAHRDAVEPHLLPLSSGDDAPAVRGRRLRRLLRQRAPRHQRRPDLPARRRAADAELEAPAHRLPRPRRHRRRVAAPTSSGPPGSARPRPTRRRSFGPSVRLDIEAELGFVVGGATATRQPRGASTRPTTTSSAWCCSTTGAPATSRPGSTCRSARSSASRSRPAISPWVVPMAALHAARVALPGQDPEPLPYLRGRGRRGDVRARRPLEVRLNGTVVARPRVPRRCTGRPTQMLAHLTRQRRQPARRRPVRVGHDQRRRRPARAGRCSS